jgi:hypothetical protein
MLVGADDGAIEEVQVPIELPGGVSLLRERVKQLLEDPSFLPTVKAARHRPPRAVTLRQVVPGGAGAENPQHPIKEAAMVDSGPSYLRFLGRKQRLEPLLLGIGHVSVHNTL